ncbi:type VI secretion system tip protein VgrG, partial [Massilia glaciei]
MVSSYKIDHNCRARDPAGDNAAGIALLKQAVKLGEVFSAAARTHETVEFAAHKGAGMADSSALDGKAGPLKAMLTAVSGMVDTESLTAAEADAKGKNVSAGDEKVPHSTDPIIAIAAKGGLGVVAGQSLQLA